MAKYKRVLIKLSGEALGDHGRLFDFEQIDRVADVIRQLHETGAEIAIVIGAGNIWRGRQGPAAKMTAVNADHMGMLGTAINSIAMQDAVVMVTDFRELRRSGMPLREAILHGSAVRFRAVILTTLTTLLGLLPLLISTGIGAEVQRPLAAIVVFGLSTSTLLTLFFLPALYFEIERWFEKRAGRSPPLRRSAQSRRTEILRSPGESSTIVFPVFRKSCRTDDGRKPRTDFSAPFSGSGIPHGTEERAVPFQHVFTSAPIVPMDGSFHPKSSCC